MQNFAPIALFVYNRPWHTEQTLKSLAANKLAKESDLYIFADGAKSTKDVLAVNKVRELILRIEGFKSVSIIKSEKNKGLANSIIEGVTSLLKTNETIIVIEDDLLSSPYTLQYFNDALIKYEIEEKVMHIGAYMYNLKENTLPETFFYRAVTSWGWATWKRAWKHFEPDINKLISQFDEVKIRDFTVNATASYWKQMNHFKKGKNDSWAVRWYASYFLQGGLALNPSKSLIENIGQDGSGIHSGVSDIFKVNIQPLPITSFPDKIIENEAAVESIKYFFKHHKGNLLRRVIRLAKQQCTFIYRTILSKIKN